MLTDAQGRFSFAQFTDPQAYAIVNKPGYTSASADGPAMFKVPDLEASLELKLYPEGVIAGTVTARNGTPLPGVTVQLSRAVFDTSGLYGFSIRSAVATNTDFHGNYRFQQPAGRYRITTRSSSSLAQTGETLMPASFPTSPSSATSGFFPLSPGQELRANLSPATGLPVPVHVKLDGANEADLHGRVSLIAVTEGGLSFFAPAEQEAPGLYRTALLPGAYQLKVTLGDRDARVEGSARVTITRREAQQVAIHLAELALLPVELAVDPSSQPSSPQTLADQTPNLTQFNLQLQSVDAGSDAAPYIYIQQVEGGGYAFRAPAGHYRLIGIESAWSVKSAFYGNTNLAGGEINVAGGSGSAPIRLVVSNVTGQLTGTVQMGAASSAWLYLIPRRPGLRLYYAERLGANGVYNQRLPVGSYTVFAVEDQLQADLRDPRVLREVAAQSKDAEVTAGGQTQLDLALAPGIPLAGPGSSEPGGEF